MDPWALTLSLNLVFAVIGGAGVCLLLLLEPSNSYPFLQTAWSPLDAWDIAVLCLLAAVSIGIHVFLARAYQLGPTAAVAGLDFSYLGFAAFWAFAFFGTAPDTRTVVGTCLIAMGGLWGILSTRRFPRVSR